MNSGVSAGPSEYVSTLSSNQIRNVPIVRLSLRVHEGNRSFSLAPVLFKRTPPSSIFEISHATAAL